MPLVLLLDDSQDYNSSVIKTLEHSALLIQILSSVVLTLFRLLLMRRHRNIYLNQLLALAHTTPMMIMEMKTKTTDTTMQTCGFCPFFPILSLICCVFRFVDRDMFMRYRGGGVGHKISWSFNRVLLQRDTVQDDEEEEGEEEEEEEEEEALRPVTNTEIECENSMDEGEEEGQPGDDSNDSDGYAGL